MKLLDDVVAEMSCAAENLPKVWDAIDAKSDADAETRRDADCDHRFPSR